MVSLLQPPTARSALPAEAKMLACPQFNALGINWAGTLLGCVAVVMAPIAVIFYIYGPRIRKKSKFAPQFTADEELENFQ